MTELHHAVSLIVDVSDGSRSVEVSLHEQSKQNIQTQLIDRNKLAVNRYLTALQITQMGVPVEYQFIGIQSLQANTKAVESAFVWGAPVPVVISNSVVTEVASQQLSSVFSIRVNQPLNNWQVALNQKYTGLDIYSIRPTEDQILRGLLLTDLSGTLNLNNGPYIPSGIIRWGGDKLTDRPASPMRAEVGFSTRLAEHNASEAVISWGAGESRYVEALLPYPVEPPAVKPGDIPTPNIKATYIIMNSFNVYALPSRAPLFVDQVTMDLDQSSFAWRFNLSGLNESSADLLKPDDSGFKEFEIEINGHVFVGIAIQQSGERRIDNNRLVRTRSVVGYSRTKLLGAPHSEQRTRSIGTTTAVQAATSELDGTGFTLDWNTLAVSDWPMANSSFSYQSLTRMQVIKRLADTVGAFVLPGLADKTIRVLPRFKVMPWALVEADADVTISEHQLLSETDTAQPQPLFNGVLISGESEGVSTEVVRYGTAGDRIAPDVVDGWLTDLDANKMRGSYELARSGNVRRYTWDLSIPEGDAQPGLIQPGMIAAVVHDDSSKDFKVYVESVGITARTGSAIQTVTVLRSEGWEA